MCLFENFYFLAAPLGTTEYIFTWTCYIPIQMMQGDSFLFLFQFCWMCCSKNSYYIQWRFYLFMNFALSRPRSFFLFIWRERGALVRSQLFRSWYICFDDVSVNANPISVRLRSKRQRINTITFYLCDISTPLVGVVFRHIN